MNADIHEYFQRSEQIKDHVRNGQTIFILVYHVYLINKLGDVSSQYVPIRNLSIAESMQGNTEA